MKADLTAKIDNAVVAISTSVGDKLDAMKAGIEGEHKALNATLEGNRKESLSKFEALDTKIEERTESLKSSDVTTRWIIGILIAIAVGVGSFVVKLVMQSPPVS